MVEEISFSCQENLSQEKFQMHLQEVLKNMQNLRTVFLEEVTLAPQIAETISQTFVQEQFCMDAEKC